MDDEGLVSKVAEILWDWQRCDNEMSYRQHLAHMKKYDCDVSWQERVSETKAEARRIIALVRGENKR